MKINNLKINYILNLTRMLLGSMFILLSMPYVNRILGSTNLGKVEYNNSIISYILLLTALGIPSYGIREVGKVRENKDELSKLVLELLFIVMITSVIGYVIVAILIFNVKEVKANYLLFLILSIDILFSNVGVDWFYQGIENQIYITKRFVFMRLIGLVMLFTLLKKENDYIIYAIIIVIMNSGSNFFNLINLRKYIKLKKFKELNLKKHIKPIVVMFSATLAMSIYLQLDTVMIGSIVGVKYVGFYSVAIKFIRLLLIIITSLGSVMIARLSNCIQNNNIELYKKYANYSLKLVFFLAIPMSLGIFILANEIIFVMAGTQFVQSIMTLRILSFMVLFIGLSNFIGFQVLYPHNLERYYTFSVIGAVIINITFNFLFIKKFYQNGAALATLATEAASMIMMIFFAKEKLKKIEFFNLKNLKYLFASIIMGIVIFILKKILKSEINILLTSILLGGIFYIGILFLLKETIIMSLVKNLKLKRGKI